MAMEVDVQITNNATGTLIAGISDSAVALQLQVGEGAEFPVITGTQYFYVTITNVTGDIEIVKVTAVSGDQFTTIVRAQDNTVAQAWLASDIVSMRPIAIIFEDMVAEMHDGTPSTSFQIDDDNTGPRIKNNTGTLEVRDDGDAAYANMQANDIQANDIQANDLLALASTNQFIQLDVSAGVIEICDAGGDAAIDFKTLAASDFDCRIIQASAGLLFYTGGNASPVLALTIDSSQNLTMANGSFTATGNIKSGVADDFVTIDEDGGIDICDSGGSPYINFKTAASKTADCQIIQSSDGLVFQTGGDGAMATALVINSGKTATFTSSVNAAQFNAGSGNILTTGTITTGDHGTPSTDEVINHCYGTGSPPAASTTTEGTIFVKYIA